MKKVTAVLILSLIIISACIFHLVRTGISLRTSPLIQPSVISEDQTNIAPALLRRLFEEMQDHRYVLWGVLPETDDSRRLLNEAAENYEKLFHQPVRYIRDAENADAAYLAACAKPCWLLVDRRHAHQLQPDNFAATHLTPLNQPFFSISLVQFTGDEKVTDECENQKRLSFECLVTVSVRGAKRKMKDSHRRYFFLNKYNDRDYFLFIQSPV